MKNEIIVTQDFVDGAKAVFKELDKKCKKQKQLIDYYQEHREVYDWDDIKEEKEKLKNFVQMKILAEKTWRKYRHILREQSELHNV